MKNLKFLGIVLIGLFFIWHHFSKDDVHSISDLKEIKGTVRYYSFKEDRNFRRHSYRHSYRYYIYLNEYSNDFRISADFIDWFYKSNFEQDVQQYDSLKLLIPKQSYDKIIRGEEIQIFGIKSESEEYLSTDADLLQNYNGNGMLIWGLAFIFVGVILLYFNRKNGE